MDSGAANQQPSFPHGEIGSHSSGSEPVPAVETLTLLLRPSQGVHSGAAQCWRNHQRNLELLAREPWKTRTPSSSKYRPYEEKDLCSGCIYGPWSAALLSLPTVVYVMALFTLFSTSGSSTLGARHWSCPRVLGCGGPIALSYSVTATLLGINLRPLPIPTQRHPDLNKGMVGCLHNLTNTTGCPLQSRGDLGDESKHPGDVDAVARNTFSAQPLRHPRLDPHHLVQKPDIGNRKIVLPGPPKPCHCLGPSHQQPLVRRLCSVL